MSRIPTFLLVFFLLPASAFATSVVRFPFDSLCTTAERIVRVACDEVSSDYRADEGRVYTTARFRVLEALKGDESEGDRLELRLPGGQAEGRTQFVPGIPVFRPGDEMVLFLSGPSEDTGSRWPVGLAQGCYAVSVTSTGERVVALQAGVTPLPEGAAFKPASARSFKVDLGLFRQAVRDAIARASDDHTTPSSD